MVCGASVLWWRTRAVWAEALFGVSALLVVLLLIAPAAYRPIERALEWLQQLILGVFTWSLLALVFVFIFLPAGIWLRISGSSRLRRSRKADTYWRPSRPRNSAKFFGQQF